MKTIHIRELDKHNPGYKDRHLIWCKVYFKMINADPNFELLCEIDKWRFVALVMLELQLKEPVPLNEEYLKRKGFDFKKRSMSLSLQMLHNLVECVEVRNATVTQNRIEESRVEEKRKDESRGFQPPLPLEVVEYAMTINYPIDGNQFIDFYSSKNWMIGKNKMSDWRAAVRTWKRRDETDPHTGKKQETTTEALARYEIEEAARAEIRAESRRNEYNRSH